jgi:superfamily II DNA or RNA helicase
MDLYHRVRASRGNGNRIIVVQASTGSGKSSWAAFLAKQAAEKGNRVLFLVHRRKLVDQLSERLREFEVEHGVIMAGEHQHGSALVQVASRDTLMSRVFRNEWTGLPAAEVVIVDESHRSINPDSDYRKILNCYPNATILLMTATPVGPEGQGFGPWATAMECAAPTSQLVKDGFLMPIKCYAPDRKIVRGRLKKGIAGDLVESWKEFAEDLPTILFVSRVQFSKDAVDSYNAAGIPAAHIDADTPDDERDRLFGEVERGNIKVISNVGVGTEGLDVPCLGCCQFYLKDIGLVKYIQGVGRVMRPDGVKKKAVLIDHSGCVLQYGYPDEDREWTLEGNAEAKFKEKQDKGLTERVNYCKECQLLFSSLACPDCGRMPVKPPRSIFAPVPDETTNEPLFEVDRTSAKGVWEKEEKIKHWMRCLAVAANKNGSFGMASQIFKQKYGSFPTEDFPCMPDRSGWKNRVADIYPKFRRSK